MSATKGVTHVLGVRDLLDEDGVAWGKERTVAVVYSECVAVLDQQLDYEKRDDGYVSTGDCVVLSFAEVERLAAVVPKDETP